MLIDKITKFSLLLLLLVIFSKERFANSLKIPDYHFENVFISQDLLNTGFIQDQDGFFWIGTQTKGVIKFDGYTSKYFHLNNSNISNNTITAILEDSTGNIWITTANGLNRYDKESDTFTQFFHDPNRASSISNNGTNWSPQVLLEDMVGNLWIGTKGGLSKLDKTRKRFTNYFHAPKEPTSLSSNNIYSLFEDSSGTIWVGTENGLNRLHSKSGTFERFMHNQSKRKGIRILSIAEENDNGRFLLGTMKDGLFVFDPKSKQLEQYSQSNSKNLGDNHISTITKTPEGLFWLTHSLSYAGMTLYNSKSNGFTNYTSNQEKKESLSADGVFSVYYDNRNALWVQMNSGIDKYDPNERRLKLYSKSDGVKSGLEGVIVHKAFEDSSGKLWLVMGDSGLYQYDPKEDRFIRWRPKDPTEIPINTPREIAEDSEGVLWIGSRKKLIRFDKEKEKVTNHWELNAVLINSIIEDINNRDILWISTYKGGLIKFSKTEGVLRQFLPNIKDPSSISADSCWKMVQEPDGSLLMPMTNGGGLNIFDTKTETFQNFKTDRNNPKSPSNSTMSSILKSADGEIWITTFGGGLNKFDPESKTFTHYNIENGLFPNNTLGALIDDEHGVLWIGSADGELIKFDPLSNEYRVYRKEDGVKPGAFTPTSSLRTNNGEIWIGGMNGINRFHPDKLFDNNFVPPVYLTSLTQGGEPLELNKAPEQIRRVNLSWKENYFEFEVAALNYTYPEKNRYAYMLEGHDKDWYFSGTNRKGRYSNLSGGHYTLRVRGSNNDGVWNNRGVSIEITIDDPFWKTWWFYSICTLFTLGILGIIYNYQLKAKTSRLIAEKKAMEHEVIEREKEAAKREKEAAEAANHAKSAFLANMSHEIRTPMNSILGFTEISINKEKDPQIKGYLQTIHRSGKALLSLINDILDLSKVEAGKMSPEYAPTSLRILCEELTNIFKQQAADQGVNFTVEILENLPEVLLLDETRLRQILMNLIGNAIKFTKSGYIKLIVSFDYPDELQSSLNLSLSVEDTGIGIPKDQIDYVFGAFNQKKGQKVSSYGGTGLGLPITKRLTEIMNGEIKVTSEEGKGSTFTVVLKHVEITKDKERLKQKESVIDFDSIEFEKATLLIADDIEYNREVIKIFLEDWPFTIREAVNGEEVIEIMKETPPDLIFLDMKMPVMNGYEAINIIKDDTTLNRIPLVAVTASAMKEDEEIINNFCDEYLKKPISKSEVVTALMKYIPYKQKTISTSKQQSKEQETEQKSFTTEEWDHFPDALKLIRERKEQLVEMKDSALSIDILEQLADELKEIGEQHNFLQLCSWADELKAAANNFELDNLNKMLLFLIQL